MTWLWIPITLFASFCQTIRTALQKALSGQMSVNASAFIRFAYGAPFALLYLWALACSNDVALPRPNVVFLGWIVMGALAQIVATSLLLFVLHLRNFPVGIAYSKTETIQAAVFGLLFLGDRLTGLGILALLLSTFGVMLFSTAKGSITPRLLIAGIMERPALLGMISGGCFGLSAIAFRGASLSSAIANPFLAASYALAFSTMTQTCFMAVYLGWREKEQFAKLARAWKPSLLAGLASVLGSAGWFTAMTLQKVAYVRTLALVELVFIFAVSFFWFREQARWREIIGILFLALGIGLVIHAA